MYLNTPVIYNQQPSKVDKSKGIIHDVIVAKTGEAKGHKFKLDDNFISEVVKLGNEHGPGIKARFGHPNICSTALGTYLGRFKNFKLSPPSQGGVPAGGGGSLADGVHATADLYLDQVSKKSPNGNLYDYVLDMAESNSDMFGASIAFKHGKFRTEFKEVEGKNIEQRFATIESLYATDFVDSPAATDGLFEVFHEDDLASQVTMFLDEHPQVFKLLDKKPDILNEFLEKYKTHKTMSFKEEIEKLRKWAKVNLLSQLDPDADKTEADTSILDVDSLIESFDEKIEALEKKYVSDEMKDLQGQLDSFVSDFNTVSAEYESLQNENAGLQSELNQLKAKPSAPNVQSDPQLNINPKDKDETGKILLSELPPHLRKKLKIAGSQSPSGGGGL